jgi:hypothetical protein
MFGRALPSFFGRVALAATLIGGAPAALRAQDAAPAGPLGSALGVLGFTPEHPAATPDFVRRTEPSDKNLDYIPFGAARSEPSDKPMTRDEIQAEEARLSGVRASDDRRVGHRPPTVVARSAAGEAPKPKKKKQPAPCRMTCQIDLTKIGQRGSMQ